MNSMEARLEGQRLSCIAKTSDSHKKNFGQYLTPYGIAKFMASFFPVCNGPMKILDPGAGIGSLSCALLDRIATENWGNREISLSAYDSDSEIIPELEKNLEDARQNLTNLSYTIFEDDFLEKTGFEFSFGQNEKFTHVIMNPPYKKIASNSKERSCTRLFGFETVNLYSAFAGAAIAQLENNGFLVAILPRSFCNGVYYKPFREFILKNCAIRRIHLFESRKKAFKDESVLQENIIIMLQKSAEQGKVTVSHSADSDFSHLAQAEFDFSMIVSPHDRQKYFNIPVPEKAAILPKGNSFVSLKETGSSVSTGTIVDFRTRDFIRKNPESGTVPLLYPVHFRNYKADWPKDSKKPNAILNTAETAPMLAPAGFYVVVKRFSAKEEKKRLVASIVSSDDIKAEALAFENHLNVFHENKRGLSKDLAYGLTVWLNTTFLDQQFRLFSGHTQVNATDLRNLPYPTFFQLEEMGRRLESHSVWSQALFDEIAAEALDGKRTAVDF